MKFEYRAKERNGNLAAGELDASSLVEARGRLRSQGLYVLTIRPTQASSLARGMRVGGARRVKRGDMVMMLSQLTIMCQSGVDLAEALQTVAGQAHKPALRAVMERVSADVASGASFSDAVRKHPHVFDASFVAGIAAGEQSGAITHVLERLTYLQRSDMRLRNAVWSMLTYPLVLCVVTMFVLLAMVFFVLPQFAKVFESLDQPPPPLTQALLSVGDLARENGLLVVASVILLVVGTYGLHRTELASRIWDYVTLHLAIVGKATRSLIAGRTFRLLGTMLMSGVPLVDGIRLCRSAARNRLFRSLFDQVERDLLRGENLSRSFFAAPFLPGGAAQMVATAERSGRLGDVLQTVGEYFEDEGERHLRDLVKVLEPAIIVFLGVVVAGVVLSVILPLLDVSTMSH